MMHKVTSLGKLCDVSIGRTPSRNRPDFWRGPNAWVSIADLNEKEIRRTREGITDLAIRESACQPVDPGTLLLSFKLSLGKVAFAGTRLFTNEAIAALPIRDPDQIESRYLYYRLCSMDWASLGRRAVKGNCLNKAILEEAEIRYPELPEQRRIAERLEHADKLIRTRRYALEVTGSLLQAAFLEVFGDPMANPHGWDRARVCDLGDVVTGNTPPREITEYYGNAIEWIKSDNISLSRIHPSIATEGLSTKGIEVARVADRGASLLTCIAGSEASIGNVVLTDRRVAFNQQINAVIPHPDVTPQFLYGLLLAAKPMIQRNTTLAMKRMITKGKLEKLVLIKPPLPLQQKFSAIIERVERLRAGQRESLRQAEHLFSSLVHQSFGG